VSIVILCFHEIGQPDRALEPDEAQYWIDVDQFESLLTEAARNPSIQLSFDDGNASDASVALPALVARGLTATFFVIAGRLGQPGSLTVKDVRALADAGMAIGSHGMHHRAWRSLDESALHEELGDAAATLAEAAGVPVRHAACPFGSYDRRVLEALRSRGFTRVYTVDRLPADPDAWLQARYVVRNGDTPHKLRTFGREGVLQTAMRTAKCTLKRWR